MDKIKKVIKNMQQNEDSIVLFVGVPACKICWERINNLMKEMKCWTNVSISYPSSSYGSKIWLYFDKNDKDTDYWECAKQAKEILENYHYRVM